MEIKGRCLCGAVWYSAPAEPALWASAIAEIARSSQGPRSARCSGCRRPSLNHGEVKTFSKSVIAGNRSCACSVPECGSSIAEAPSTRPGMLILNAGTLDDPTSVRPRFELYCDRTLPWVQLGGEMRRFPKMPE